jgi:hypothetical protein
VAICARRHDRDPRHLRRADRQRARHPSGAFWAAGVVLRCARKRHLFAGGVDLEDSHRDPLPRACPAVASARSSSPGSQREARYGEAAAEAGVSVQTGRQESCIEIRADAAPDAGGHPRLSRTPRSGLNRDRTHRGQKMAPLQRKSMASLWARSKE